MRLKEYVRGFVSLSLVLSFVERKTVKKRRGFIVVRSRSIGLLRFLLSRERRLKKEKR